MAPISNDEIARLIAGLLLSLSMQRKTANRIDYFIITTTMSGISIAKMAGNRPLTSFNTARDVIRPITIQPWLFRYKITILLNIIEYKLIQINKLNKN